MIGHCLLKLNVARFLHRNIELVYSLKFSEHQFSFLLQKQVFLFEVVDLKFLLVDDEIALRFFRAKVEDERQRQLLLLRGR